MKVPHAQLLTKEKSSSNFLMWPKDYTKPQGQLIEPMATHFCYLVWEAKASLKYALQRKPSQNPGVFSSTFTGLLHILDASPLHHQRSLTVPSWPSGMSEDVFIYQVNSIENNVFTFVNQSLEKCQSYLLICGNSQQAQSKLTSVILHSNDKQNETALTCLGKGSCSELIWASSWRGNT